MAVTYTTTDKASDDHGIKCLVYGAAGVGKTTLCGTAPNPLIISAEAGLLSLRSKSIKVAIIENDADLQQVLNACKSGEVKGWGVETICLDSISEIAEQILLAEKGKTKDPRQAYGELSNRAIDYVKQFRDLAGFHVLVTAKQTQSTDPVTGVVKATPTAPGQQIGPALPYLFDEVFHAFTDKDPATGKTFHALRTHAAFNADAKDRSGVLDELEYPDLSHIIAKIMTVAQ